MKRERFVQIILFLSLLPLAIYSQETSSVEAKWKRAVGGKITSWQAQGPDGMIYLLADDQALHAIDPQTGQDKWFYRPGGRLTPFLAVSPDGTIYIQNEDNQIFAVNPGGQARWKCSVESPVQQMPTLTPEGTLIFLQERGVLAALSRKGEILWTQDLPSTPLASPILDYRGQVYIGLEDRILAFNLDGEELWSLSLSQTIQLAVDQRGFLYAISGQGRIRSFSSTGELLWDTGTEPGEVVSLALRENDILIQTASGVIFRANQEGSESFYQGPRPLRPGYLTAQGDLCFFDQDYRFIRLSFETGQEEVLFTSPSEPSLPLITAQGDILFGGSDWRFYSYEGLIPHGGWSQFRANQRRDGSLYAILSPTEKEALYKDDSRWLYYNYILLSEEPADHLSLVQDIRDYGENRTGLEVDIPFWDLLMLKLSRTKDDKRTMVGDEGYQDNPVVRAEAYHLLGEWAVFPARNSILATVKQEKDPFVLASACYALGEIGSDWDGQSTRVIGQILSSYRNQQSDRLMLEAGWALEKILLYNGGDVASLAWEYYSQILDSEQVSNQVKMTLLEE